MARSDKINESKKRKCEMDGELGEISSDNSASAEKVEDFFNSSEQSATISDDGFNESIILDIVDSKETETSSDIQKDIVDTEAKVELEVGASDASQFSDSNSTNISKPIFKVIFRDKDVARKYQEQVKRFLESLISSKTKGMSFEELDGAVLGLENRSLNSDSVAAHTARSDDDSETDSLFVVDTKPKLKDDLDIPTYGKKFDTVLEKFMKKLEPEETPKFKMSCFNCSGEHNLRDCTKPRNQANINRNRKQYTSKMGPKNARYHQEDDQRFGHLVPGQLSTTLRRALGLREDDLPRHIYRMRILGYPPGWLEEARLQHSGLTLFNSDGSEEIDQNLEQGEITSGSARDQFDVKKIVDFPGFNVPPPHGTRDDSKQHYWAPQMQAAHSKETMLSMLSGRESDNGYKRKKLKVAREQVADDIITTTDIEVVDIDETMIESVSTNGLFVPPLPRDIPQKPPEPPLSMSEDSDSQSQEPQSPDSMNDSAAASPRPNSPSLSDLESVKTKLLAELDDSNSLSNCETPVKNVSLDTIRSTPKGEMSPLPITEAGTPRKSQTQSVSSTPTSNRGSVKSIDLGTPILQSTSPYNKLPASDKFSKDICDVIYFENLPDATGKYEQMTGIIQKVREAVAKLQQE